MASYKYVDHHLRCSIMVWAGVLSSLENYYSAICFQLTSNRITHTYNCTCVQFCGVGCVSTVLCLSRCFDHLEGWWHTLTGSWGSALHFELCICCKSMGAASGGICICCNCEICTDPEGKTKGDSYQHTVGTITVTLNYAHLKTWEVHLTQLRLA